MGLDPLIHFSSEGLNAVIYDGVVSGFDVLGACHQNRLVTRFVHRELAFLKAADADFPFEGLVVAIVSAVIEEGFQRGKGLSKKGEMSILIRSEIGKSIGKRGVCVGAANTVVDIYGELRDKGKPQLPIGR